MDKLTTIKIKYPNGTYSNPIDISVTAENVRYDRFDTVKNFLNRLNLRVNNIIALPEGSTTSDGALRDIQTGYDGTQYDNPGEAVRNQIRDLHNIIPEIDNTLSVSEAVADAATVGNVIAPIYSTVSAYNIGDYVNYNGTIYRCKIAIGSGGEAWTVGHWEATNISNEFKNVDQDVTNLKSAITKTTETRSYTTSQGKYINYTTGDNGSAENYTTALNSDGNFRIKIPVGCETIIFNNVVQPSAGVSGWATYSTNSGSSTNDFIRGARTNIIEVQDGDKYYAVSSGKSNGSFVSPISVTYVYTLLKKIDSLDDAITSIKVGKETEVLSSNQGIYVSSTTGLISSASNYTTAKDENGNMRMPIPENCIQILFENITLNREGNAGWATYSAITGNSTSAFVRGGRSDRIDVQPNDKYFAVSSGKMGGAYGSFVNDFVITFVYSIAGSELVDIKNSISVANSAITLNTTPLKYINYTNGSVSDYSSGVYSIAENILIPQNCIKIVFPDVVFKTDGVAGWAIYDSDGTYIRGGQTNEITIQPGDVVLGVTAYSNSTAPTTIDYIVIYEKINEEIYKLQKGINSIYRTGQTIVMLGDSIIGNYDGSGSIPYYLSEFTGATCYNCAFGGSSIASDLTNPDARFEPFNGWKIMQSITTNNYSAMQAAIDDPNISTGSNYQTHLNTLKNMDWDSVDIITLSYGTNDWGTNVILEDNVNDMKDVTTFGGALRTSLETLWSVYPHIKVVICGIIWRGWNVSNGQIVRDSDERKNDYNCYLYEFEEKLKSIHEEYHTPFIPMYNYIGFNRYNWSVYFPSNDGTHPNAVGRKAIAKRYAAHMIELTKN